MREVLSLPAGVRACLFDLDGVLTPTAAVHAAAWQETFDDFLRQRAARGGDDHPIPPAEPGPRPSQPPGRAPVRRRPGPAS
ncbi:hypothetical protein AB0M46_19455 [Dactylosporangium sp. NPDC051485]|uniref:hypothetical protein n=1 Tax=Dactylosporangium sp. NPDC051485 TaxID=3154846 RepID=UPI00343601D6